MTFIKLSSFKAAGEVVSGVLNCGCLEWGGIMGGRGGEFKCQGECQIYGRQLWEHLVQLGAHVCPPYNGSE
jgi:hypothetical protein